MKFTELGARDSGAVDAAADHLALGGLLAHPTGGVYGIGGSTDEATEEELARLKGRSLEAGFVYLASGMDELRSAFPALRWTPLAERLVAQFWPGPLTLVLEDGSPRGVAVRVEPHPFTREVLERLGGVMSSTSLNLSGEPASMDSETARRSLEAMPASDHSVLFVDAGTLPGPPPSTLVRIPGRRGEAWELLREGAIGADRLRAAVDATPDDATPGAT